MPVLTRLKNKIKTTLILTFSLREKGSGPLSLEG